MAGLLLPPSTSSQGPPGSLAVCSQPSPSHSALISPGLSPGERRSSAGVRLATACFSRSSSSLPTSARLAGTCPTRAIQTRRHRTPARPGNDCNTRLRGGMGVEAAAFMVVVGFYGVTSTTQPTASQDMCSLPGAGLLAKPPPPCLPVQRAGNRPACLARFPPAAESACPAGTHCR